MIKRRIVLLVLLGNINTKMALRNVLIVCQERFKILQEQLIAWYVHRVGIDLERMTIRCAVFNAKDKAKEKASQEKDDALQKEMTALAHSMQDVKEATQKEIIPNEKPFVAGTNGEALDTTIQLPFESIYGIACLG